MIQSKKEQTGNKQKPALSHEKCVIGDYALDTRQQVVSQLTYAALQQKVIY